jgi:C1A family cysteine protease
MKSKKSSATASVEKRILNLVPSKQTEQDWSYQTALNSGALKAPQKAPTSVDLRQSWWTINDQKNTGSCVGWASADGVMRYHLATAGRIAKSEMLSPRFVWMASKESDEFDQRPQTFIEESGTSLKAAVDVLRNYGAALESELPFNINTSMYSGSENDFYASASTRKLANYFNLLRDLSEWRAWLASKGPILAGLSVDDTWQNAPNGKLQTFLPNTVRGGHAVCIVGYTAKHFIIRNSWGTSWGDAGFGYASDSYITKAFFAESYGITL